MTDAAAIPLLPGQIPWQDAALIPARPDPEFTKRVRRITGDVPRMLPYVTGVPWLAELMMAGNGVTMRTLSWNVVHLTNLVIAQDNSCRYCYGATRAMMKLAGYSEDTIRRIETELHTAPLSEADRAALEFARKVSRCNPRVGADDFEALARTGWSRESALELAMLAANNVIANKVSTLVAVQPEPIEGFERSFLGRVLRPLVGAMIRRMKHKPWPLDPLPAGATTPLDPLFMALGDTPGTDALRWGLARALESPVIPRRQKAMMMAVIAAGLSCRTCARGSRDELGREGWEPAEVDRMVEHLSSPRLSERDTALVRFARETVRYRVDHMHRKCKELYATLSREEAIEVIGFCSLANGLGRLTVLLER